MAASEIVYAVKPLGEVLEYLQSELAAGRWICPDLPCGFMLTQDTPYSAVPGPLSVSYDAAINDGRLFMLHTSDTSRLAVSGTDPEDVGFQYGVEESDWQAALDEEIAAGREPIVIFYLVGYNGQRYFFGIFYAIT